MRYQRADIPNTRIRCPMIFCVYNDKEEGNTCDEPRTNKGNSDAKCHYWSNKRLLETIAPSAL